MIKTYTHNKKISSSKMNELQTIIDNNKDCNAIHYEIIYYDDENGDLSHNHTCGFLIFDDLFYNKYKSIIDNMLEFDQFDPLKFQDNEYWFGYKYISTSYLDSFVKKTKQYTAYIDDDVIEKIRFGNIL